MLVMASLIIAFGLCGLGYAESQVLFVFKYDLPYSEWTYSSHSVTFAHATRAMTYKIACTVCHHHLEEGAPAVEETCTDCHTNTDMKSYLKAEKIPEENRMEYYFLAIHDQCINCHKAVKRSGNPSTAPVACWQCHVREKKSRSN
jgi:hypothetical protein